MNAVERRRTYVRGGVVEIWEDPDRPFGCDPVHIRTYLDRGDWVMLFNAIVLRGALGAAPE
jgi:hypothetical protein